MLSRTSMLALAAVAALAASSLMPADAAAAGHRNRLAAPMKIVSPKQSLGWGYGRGWCYWHPYACYYR
jgi:hypothetical protein